MGTDWKRDPGTFMDHSMDAPGTAIYDEVEPFDLEKFERIVFDMTPVVGVKMCSFSCPPDPARKWWERG